MTVKGKKCRARSVLVKLVRDELMFFPDGECKIMRKGDEMLAELEEMEQLVGNCYIWNRRAYVWVFPFHGSNRCVLLRGDLIET
jgi:hypothetical protein